VYIFSAVSYRSYSSFWRENHATSWASRLPQIRKEASVLAATRAEHRNVHLWIEKNYEILQNSFFVTLLVTSS
jgi:hypothetical protein